MREVLKPIFSILFMQMVLFDICLADAQSYNPYNQGNTFDVNGVFIDTQHIQVQILNLSFLGMSQQP